MHGTPRDSHYASDKFRMNAIISREDEARWLDQHRHPQLAGTDKERDRQYMHQQVGLHGRGFREREEKQIIVW